jgi:hypothetical protein
MRYAFRRAIGILAFCFVLPACTTVGETKQGAVAYNKTFTDARNEILLLNIMRASEREPQQFSTISSVTGGMRADMKLSGELDNILLGASKVFKPSGEFSFRNPAVTITPLETKEFREGMAKPLEPSFVDRLLAEGWDTSVVLHLVIGGIQCTPETANQNFGSPDKNPLFVYFARLSQWDMPDQTPAAQMVTVPIEEGAKILQKGLGEGVKVKLVTDPAPPPGHRNLKFVKDSGSKITGLRTDLLCAGGTRAVDADDVILRSPAAIIQYLGNVVRSRQQDPFFVVESMGGTPPLAVLVATQFHDRFYYVRRSSSTAETLALLAEIIGFQTSSATLDAGKPQLTISQ